MTSVDLFVSNTDLELGLNHSGEVKGVFFVEQRTLPQQCLKSALLSTMVRKNHNLEPISLLTTPIVSSSKIFKYFGITQNITVSLRAEYKNIGLIIILTIASIFDLLSFLIKGRDFTDFIENYRIKGVHVGDLLFDKYIRSKNRFIKPQKHIFSLLYEILKAQYLVRKVTHAFDHHKPELVIVTTRAYASLGGIMSRVALRRSIPTWVAGSNYKYKLYRYEDAFQGDYHYSLDDLHRGFPTNWEGIVHNYLESRFKGDLVQHDVKFAFDPSSDKELIHLQEWQKSSGDLPLVIIFAHAFSDANNFNGAFSYYSYYEWLKQTLKTIKNNDNCLVVVKPHPSAELYEEDINIYRNLLDEIGVNSFYLLCGKVNTKSVLDIASTIITCRGTITLEATALGIPCITAACPPFGDFSINHRAYNLDQYKTLLKSCTEIDGPDPYQIELAKRLIYKHLIIDLGHGIKSQDATGSHIAVIPNLAPIPNSDREQIEIFFEKFFSELNANLANSKLQDDLDYKKLEEFSQFL